jgi:hypothetical protein
MFTNAFADTLSQFGKVVSNDNDTSYSIGLVPVSLLVLLNENKKRRHYEKEKRVLHTYRLSWPSNVEPGNGGSTLR